MKIEALFIIDLAPSHEPLQPRTPLRHRSLRRALPLADPREDGGPGLKAAQGEGSHT